MRGPRPPAVELSDAERQALEAQVRRHTTPQQVALRARIVLASADGLNQAQVAQQVGVSVETARLWRRRWLALQAATLDDLPVRERLTDVPRPGKPSRLTAEQVCQITALACEAPATSGRPISQWTSREIADEFQRRGLVERISPRHAARLLKRGSCART
jgi:putative transposase